MILKTEIVVKKIEDKVVWVITVNDYDTSLIGETTSGPVRAKDLPIGTTYKTEFNID